MTPVPLTSRKEGRSLESISLSRKNKMWILCLHTEENNIMDIYTKQFLFKDDAIKFLYAHCLIVMNGADSYVTPHH